MPSQHDRFRQHSFIHVCLVLMHSSALQSVEAYENSDRSIQEQGYPDVVSVACVRLGQRLGNCLERPYRGWEDLGECEGARNNAEIASVGPCRVIHLGIVSVSCV